MVEIPQSLKEKLEPLGPHFIRVKRQGKQPIDKGWTVNPLSANDSSLIDWLKQGGNYGVVGGIGLTIVDLDHLNLIQIAKEKLPQTFTVQSPGSKGWHLYFLCTLEKPIRLRDEKGDNIGDIQGQGKMVVGPESIHPNGGVYKVIKDIPLAQVTRTALIEALEEFVVPNREIEQIELNARKEKRESKINLDIIQVIPLAGLQRRGNEYVGAHPIHGSDSGQNFWMNPSKNCWHCFRHGTGGGPMLWLAVEEGIISCSEASAGALRGKTFKNILKIANERGLIKEKAKRQNNGKKDSEEELEEEVSSSRKRSKADILTKIALENVLLFHDDRDYAYARVTLSEKSEKIRPILNIRSRKFKGWLSYLAWTTLEKAPSSETLRSAINILEAKALFEGPGYKLYNRVAPDPKGNGFWIDMADERWRAIHVTPDTWEVIDNPPIMFRRLSHQKPLPIPEKNGDYTLLYNFVNIPKTDKILIVVYIVTLFVPSIPHPILILHGIQGSAKSTSMKVIRELVDPSANNLSTIQKDVREMAQHLDHNWCSHYDNVSSLSSIMSDVFCRACTGGGFSKRTLYTDEEDTIMSFLRCIALNGINIAAWRPDLLDRALILECPYLPEHARKTEKEFWNAFHRVRASILGGLLDLLVKAMKLYPNTKVQTKHRMADFTVWGYAIAEAMGLKGQIFYDAYTKKVHEQVEEGVQTSLVAMALTKLMESHPWWLGKPADLFLSLNNILKDMGISTRQKGWPKAPNALTRKINRLVPSLEKVGIRVNTKSRTSDKRQILIENIVIPSLSSSDEEYTTDKSVGKDSISENKRFLRQPDKRFVSDGINDNDGILFTSKNVIFCELINTKMGICELCSRNRLLTHSFFFEGKRRLCCSQCVQ